MTDRESSTTRSAFSGDVMGYGLPGVIGMVSPQLRDRL